MRSGSLAGEIGPVAIGTTRALWYTSHPDRLVTDGDEQAAFNLIHASIGAASVTSWS